jgi:large conductance mechanosensitive channel
VNGQRINLGAFISSIVYFVTFMAVVYFIIVVPYRNYMLRRGTTVFGAPAASKTCPLCLSAGLPLAATACKFCGNDVPAA